MARTRLAPELRREQLLDLGAELFAAEPYERVHIERVAEMAGVSRGLLYHYFPTKGAFFAALVQRTVEHLRAATAPDPALSPLDQLRDGIDAYLAHCRANSHAARAVHRSAASADPDVVAIIERDNRVQEERILGALEQRRTPVRCWSSPCVPGSGSCVPRGWNGSTGPKCRAMRYERCAWPPSSAHSAACRRRPSRRGWTASPSRVPSVTRPFERRVDDRFPQPYAEPPNHRILR